MGIHSSTSLLRSENSTDDLKDWITEHRQFLEVFLDAYCIIDLNNEVVEFNVAFTELCGVSYRRILKVKNFCDLLTLECCPDNCPAKQIVSSNKSIRLDELTGRSKGYPKLRLILGGIPIVGSNNQTLGSLITIRNVSAEDELQKKYMERKVQSVTDGLTQLYNKSYTEDSLLRLVKASLRTVNSFSLAMVDIDHFKSVNDTYGHQAGDYVLATVAQIIKSQVRGSDIVGRFGGEEFIVVLANSNVSGAYRFSERLRAQIENTSIRFEGKDIPVTVSIGTATFDEKWRLGLDPNVAMNTMVNKSDQALYAAKGNGRNQTIQFETMEEVQKTDSDE